MKFHCYLPAPRKTSYQSGAIVSEKRSWYWIGAALIVCFGAMVFLSGCAWFEVKITEKRILKLAREMVAAKEASIRACGEPYDSPEFDILYHFADHAYLPDLYSSNSPGSSWEYALRARAYIAGATAAAAECARRSGRVADLDLRLPPGFGSHSTVSAPPMPPYYDQDVFGSMDITIPEKPQPVYKPKATEPKKVFTPPPPPPPPPPPVYVPPCA